MQDLIGKKIGRYIIQQSIGEGGMGAVYRALDTHLDCNVALKVLLPGRESEEVFLKRFQREARSMARLNHPNLVKVMDYGEQDGMVYLVMPYVAGGTLSKLSKPMSADQAASMLLPVARALGYAHSQGMIHRDVKPSNVLLTESGEPMVTDFGIAGLLDVAETEQITKTGSGVGTPAYMAPEQIKKDYDHRVDIYALGVVLYELVTGQQPFKGDTPLDTLVKHATEPLPPPREVNSSVSPAVEAVIVKALAKQPDQRYQTMEEFAQALQDMASGQVGVVPVQAREAASDADATVDELVTPASLSKIQAAGKKKLLWIGISGVAFLFILLAVFVFRSVKDDNESIEGLITEESSQIKVADNAEDQLVETVVDETLPPEVVLETGASKISPKDGMEQVYVPEGEFVMGSSDGENDEQPAREVVLDGFWMDKTEVTNAQYAQCVSDGACEEPKRTEFYETAMYKDHPVVHVSWFDAQAYCEWAGRRLPSEAEWEKAARGTEEQMYPWGHENLNKGLLNFGGHVGETTVVGTYPDGASPYGALDMAGNVMEWTADWYDEDYYAWMLGENPVGPVVGKQRVLRGGSWNSIEWVVRSSDRNTAYPEGASNTRGFRCAENASGIEQQGAVTPESLNRVSSTDGMEQVSVSGGEFMMGSLDGDNDEGPVHEVFLDAFSIDKFEVTNAQYAACVAEGACEEPGNTKYYENEEYADHPVVYVSWYDASQYCAWADRRLPSEAEWEKAARGTDERMYPWGNEIAGPGLLNFDNNENGTTKVGSYPDGASPYGALDMAGNVYEWVLDWYDPGYYGSQTIWSNPIGPKEGEYRSIRGGAWDYIESYSRTTDRFRYSPGSKKDNIGFRCAVRYVNP